MGSLIFPFDVAAEIRMGSIFLSFVVDVIAQATDIRFGSLDDNGSTTPAS